MGKRKVSREKGKGEEKKGEGDGMRKGNWNKEGKENKRETGTRAYTGFKSGVQVYLGIK